MTTLTDKEIESFLKFEIKWCVLCHSNMVICPKCGNLLTIGVLNRVEELADRESGYKRKNAKDFIRIIPLTELICSVYGMRMLTSKKVWEIYNKSIDNFENELNILLNVDEDRLKKVLHDKLVKVIIKNREGKLEVKPGFDVVYGEVILDNSEKMITQKTLQNF